MNIGILTLHSQLNYGGVLQCWALSRYLRELGHDVVVIDRWLDPINQTLRGPFARFSVRRWIGITIRAVAGCKNLAMLLRIKRTEKFIRKIGLTQYHFFSWKEAPRELGVDLVVVGSDQVWHSGDQSDPRPYLLEGAPTFSAIAYAASFGVKELAKDIDYAKGFRRFSCIGVREKEGVELVKSTGYAGSIQHVVDPTLLLERSNWHKFFRRNKIHRRLVCYLISEDTQRVIDMLEKWTGKNGWTVEVLLVCYGRPFPRSFRQLLKRGKEILSSVIAKNNVRVCSGYGPQEFVRAFAEADACITDSFHAVMFSSIYGLNSRFIMPRDSVRSKMFARIEEFADEYIQGNFFAGDVSLALKSILDDAPVSYDHGKMNAHCDFSRQWLNKAIKGAMGIA